MQTLLKSRKFEVVRRTVEGREGPVRDFDYVVHPGAAVVLPLVKDDEIIMLRQFRPAIDRQLWELPAGTLDVAGESPEAAALRELEEEAGLRAGRLEPMCEFYPSPGILTELIRAFVARELTETAQRLGPGERITVERMPLETAIDRVRDGGIVDAKTIITLLRWDMEREAT